MDETGWSWTQRALFLVVVVAWGLNYLFVDVGLTAASPLWLAFLRAGVGGAATAPLLFRSRTSPSLDRRGVRDAMLLGVPNTGLFLALWFLGAQYVLPGVAAVVIYTFPLWVALLSRPILGHVLAPMQTAAIAAGFVGVALISQVWEVAGGTVALLPLAALLGAAICWAFGTVLFQRRFRPEHSLDANAWGLLGGTLFLGAAVALVAPAPLPHLGSPALWESVAWLGLIGTGLAYASWYTLLARTRAATLSAYLFLVPVVALVASAVVFGERLVAIQLLGVGLVLVSLLGIGRVAARR